MIQRETADWHILLSKMKRSRAKSNKDVLCLRCWQVFMRTSRAKHEELEGHQSTTLTPKLFATPDQFIYLAKLYGKFRVIDGKEYYEDPYPMKRKNIYDKRGAWK